MASGSKVFAAFRALGIVSNDVPICIQTSHSNYFVTSAIGRAFHVYNVCCSFLIIQVACRIMQV